MPLIDDLLYTLANGTVQELRIGSSWTAVAAESWGAMRCGLASTVPCRELNGHDPMIKLMDQTGEMNANVLASLARSQDPAEASLGLAAVNALLPPVPGLWTDVDAEVLISHCGAGKNVVMVGHFPFAEDLRLRVGRLRILELNPRAQDLPATMASHVIPEAEVLVITGMTLVNHTLESLLGLKSPDTQVIVVGATAPLSPVLFDYGVHVIAGAVVENIPSVLHMVDRGVDFRQVRRAGMRLVTMQSSDCREFS